MTRQIAIYAGTIAVALTIATPSFSQVSTGSGAPPPDSTMGKGAGTGSPTDAMKTDKKTDLTGGQQGVPDSYADTPVRQGKLIEVTDSKYKGADVFSTHGEMVGKIKEVLKDKQTNEIEYVVFTSKESNRDMPLRWSLFQTKNDQLQLKLKKEEFQNTVRMSSDKDQSPDIKEYMDRINQVRSHAVPNQNANPGLPGQRGPDATGSMGEETVGGGGMSGTSGLPPGKAPGFEGGNPSSKR